MASPCPSFPSILLPFYNLAQRRARHYSCTPACPLALSRAYTSPSHASNRYRCRLGRRRRYPRQPISDRQEEGHAPRPIGFGRHLHPLAIIFGRYRRRRRQGAEHSAQSCRAFARPSRIIGTGGGFDHFCAACRPSPAGRSFRRYAGMRYAESQTARC